MKKLLFLLCCCVAAATAQTREFEVRFNSGSSQLTADQSQKLAAFIQSLPAEHQQFTIAIAGHTDNVGELSYNAVLSEKRANSIAAIFENNGFSEAKILTSGRGEVHPIASNASNNG